MPVGEDSVPNIFVSAVLVEGSQAGAGDGLATFKMAIGQAARFDRKQGTAEIS